MKLLIISHTGHGLTPEGLVVGWGPTVREIDNLAPLFKEVFHLAYLHTGPVPQTYVRYQSNRVKFVPLMPSGGSTLFKKLGVLGNAISNLRIISRYIWLADAVQLRLPTGMGVYILPWIASMVKRTFILWVKYAGNWSHPNPTLSNWFQRWFLLKNLQRSLVTINGKWKGQPDHCLTFENPCLTDEELMVGKLVAGKKSFDGKLRLLFVGRIESSKGVDRIFQMLKKLKDVKSLEQIVLVGEGASEEIYREAEDCPVPVSFEGGVSRSKLNEYYERSHILILPSMSEGFPKVVAESAAFGCIPVVSNVSSIGQYIDSSNGHVFTRTDPATMAFEFQELINNRADLKIKSTHVTVLADKFTYSLYNRRLLKEVIGRSEV